MTKRLLALAVALMMLIGLLPVTAYAADPMPKFTVKDPAVTIAHGISAGDVYYVTFEDVVDAETGEITGTKPVEATTLPEDHYMAFYYNSARNVLEILFRNVNYQRVGSVSSFFTVSKNTSSAITYSNAFDVELTLEGENTITGAYTTFLFENAGNVTITGTGSLEVETNYTSNSFIHKKNAGDLVILNTTLRVDNLYTGTGAHGGIVANGNVIVDGSVLEMNAGKCYLIRTGTSYSSMSSDTTKGIVFTHGSDVTLTGGSLTMIGTKGPLVFDNSSVKLTKSTGNNSPVFNQAPEIIGSYSSRKAGQTSLDKAYPGTYGLEPGDTVTTSHRINMFEIVHKHAPTDCTAESICACTKATVPATAESHSIEYVAEQAATCTEEGWYAYEYCSGCAYSTKILIPATGEHIIRQVQAQAETCGEVGWNAYEYCMTCDYTTLVEIPATGEHTIVQAQAQAPSCGIPGWEAHEYCSGCDAYTTKVEIPATGEHTLTWAEAKEPTCDEPGWEAYEYCTVCNNYSTKVEIPAIGLIEVKPFYLLNGEVPEDLRTYMYEKPSFYTKTFTSGQTTPTFSWSGATSIESLAAKLKAEFDNRPAGTRYFKLDAMSKTIHALVEHNVFYDEAVYQVKTWVEAFLAEYYRIGGKLDGIQVDVEYIYGGAWYIHLAYHESNDKALYNDPDIFWSIVNDPRYATEIRPMLEELGFPFLSEDKQTSVKSEIYPINTKGSKAYTIWNIVNSLRMSAAVDEAVFEPLLRYYPNARVTDYQVRYTYGWQKTHMNDATPMVGNRVGLGSTSNFNAYSSRPTTSISGTGSNPSYTTPPAFNDAVYELTPFNTFLWEMNIFKNMYDATDSKRVAAHIAFFNYNPNRKGTYSNTPYYSESFYHIALMDPEPFLGYILDNEVFANGKNSDDPNVSDFGYNLSVVEDLLAEMTRVAGASDRKHIPTQAYWNSKFVISGMYAGGRNIWRITPDTSTGVSLEAFKVKDQTPTFYINGQTVIFPQGRIISDGNVKQVGTCGYWVETPADVEPIIINDADRYSQYPSYEENFESYAAGTAFSGDTARHKATWEVTGTANVQLLDGDNVLALTGNTAINSVKLPKNITAGDSYAKQQAWEVTVTVTEGSELYLLSCAEDDLAIRIANGQVYYGLTGAYQLLEGVTLSAGSTYTIRREVDFRTADAFTSGYTIFDTDGNLLGGVDNVALATVTLPVAKIGMTNVSGTAYIDDFKLYPTGVTTEFEVYDAQTGFEVADPNAARTADSAYRLSWMNASSAYKVAKIYNNGVLVEEIPMAPGQDGVNTGIVKGDNINLSVVTENGSAATIPDYDNGDFTWHAPAEDIGLASGDSAGNVDVNNGVSVIVHKLVSVEAKAPTCNEIGWNAYAYCTECDYTTYEELAALGHQVVNHSAQAPTCTEIGWQAYETCARCDYTTYEELEALGHELLHHEGQAPTHNAAGWYAYETCSQCDYTTYRAIPIAMPKIQISWPGSNFQSAIYAGETYYIAFADNVPSLTQTQPEGGYIALQYGSTNGKPVLNVTVCNVNYTTTGTNGSNFLRIYENNNYSAMFDVVVTLVGTNVFDGYKAGIYVNNIGDLTVTGSGSLTIHSVESSSKAFQKAGTGTLYITDTTLSIQHKDTSSGAVYGLYASNDIVIDGSVVEVRAGKKGNPVYSVSGRVIVRDSDFYGEQTSGSNPVIRSTSPVVFENSNVTLVKTTGNAGHALAMAPELIGTYSQQWYSYKNTGAESTLKDYAARNYAAGDAWAGGTTAGTSYNYFKLVRATTP